MLTYEGSYFCTFPNNISGGAYDKVPQGVVNSLLYFSDNIDVILHDYAFGIIMYIITAVACGAQYVRENKLKSRAVRLM